MSSSRLKDGSESDYARFRNPMQVLAEALEVEYPVPVSDRWVRVLLALLPCTVLVVVSFLWPPSSPLLLTFVGAFASIQLQEPFQRASRRLAGFLFEAREAQRSPVGYLRVIYNFRHRAMTYQGGTPVGYSRVEHERARRRFRRIAALWGRSFWNLSGRIITPDPSQMSPAAVPRWRYPRRKGIHLGAFIRRGNTIVTRFVRLFLGLALLLGEQIVHAWDFSRWTQMRKQCRVEKTLTLVAKEIIRATSDSTADAPVAQLADQLGINYRRPKIKETWVYSSNPGWPYCIERD